MAFLSEHYDKARFRDRPTLFKGDEDSLLFTTMAHTRRYLDTAESDQAVVEYRVERDPRPARRRSTGGEGEHRRRARPGGRADLVANHVTRLGLQYWDRGRKEWIREWSTRTPEKLNELPTRVRIELEVRLADGRTEKFTTQSRVAITAPLDFCRIYQRGYGCGAIRADPTPAVAHRPGRHVLIWA